MAEQYLQGDDADAGPPPCFLGGLPAANKCGPSPVPTRSTRLFDFCVTLWRRALSSTIVRPRLDAETGHAPNRRGAGRVMRFSMHGRGRQLRIIDLEYRQGTSSAERLVVVVSVSRSR
jgi:hypothetical protein